MAHRVSCRHREGSAGCKQKHRAEETWQLVPVSSQNPFPVCWFVPFVSACMARSAHPYPVWLFAGMTVPIASNNEQRVEAADAGDRQES